MVSFVSLIMVLFLAVFYHEQLGDNAPLLYLILVGIPALEAICSLLYFKFKWFKFYFHDLLQLHAPDESADWSDKSGRHSICKCCGKEIIEDYQGNWLTKGN